MGGGGKSTTGRRKTYPLLTMMIVVVVVGVAAATTTTTITSFGHFVCSVYRFKISSCALPWVFPPLFFMSAYFINIYMGFGLN
jgi:uncharacterized membrane protein